MAIPWGLGEKLIDWLRTRPTKKQRQLLDLKAEAEIERIQASRRTCEKNAAYELACAEGERLYRENVERQGRRWLLTDETMQARFAAEFAEKHWREFLDSNKE